MAGPFDLYNILQAGVQAINNLTVAVNKLPHTTASSTQVPQTNGTLSFSSSLATGFILFETSSGATIKLATYSNP